MAESTPSLPGLLPGTLVLASGSLVGLTAYLILASAVEWIPPIWWGGEALMFPLVFGATVLLVGSVVLCLILRWVAAALKRRLTWLGHLVGGAMIGTLLMPVQRFIAASLTAIPGWEGTTPMASVFVVVAAAAACSAVAASLLVAVLPKTSR
jgi:hypothetical protein